MAGKSNRDRGRRPERARPRTPPAVSVERVDAHTLIVRSPDPFPDEALEHVRLYVSHLARLAAGPSTPLEDTPGVWLTPGEVTALEAGTDP